jgi:predicted kinase
MPGRFVALSGLPASGKSTLAHRLSPLLGLPVIDKDAILERLFDSKGAGDAIWRRRLSRESDLLFQQEAQASGGAILVSFWHVARMPADSGTPTDWLTGLSGRIVEVHCACPPEIAAERFVRRKRHRGHLDRATYAEMLDSLRALPQSGALDIGPRIVVDTSREPDVEAVASAILRLLAR